MIKIPESIRDTNTGKTWSIETDGSGKVVNKIPLDIRFDPDDNTPIYIGLNYDSYDAGTTATDWMIIKFTYDTTKTIRIQKREKVAWTDRTSLF